MLFFIGWDAPTNGEKGTKHFQHCMISINSLLKRKSNFSVKNWILDSGAFTRVVSGKGHLPTKKYAKFIKQWEENGNLMAAVSQDFMCEPFVLAKTGLDIKTHQRLTIHRYDRLLDECRKLKVQTTIMPVLQGDEMQDYLNHIEQYGARLTPQMWVGLGSVCRRNRNPWEIEKILLAIKSARPNLKLHGFGVKKTALQSDTVRSLLYSADSQAHTYALWRAGQDHHDPLLAIEYAREIEQPKVLQKSLLPLTVNS